MGRARMERELDGKMEGSWVERSGQKGELIWKREDGKAVLCEGDEKEGYKTGKLKIIGMRRQEDVKKGIGQIGEKVIHM